MLSSTFTTKIKWSYTFTDTVCLFFLLGYVGGFVCVFVCVFYSSLPIYLPVWTKNKKKPGSTSKELSTSPSQENYQAQSWHLL